MDNSMGMAALVMICIVACVMFACAGAWATVTLGDVASNAEVALTTALGGDDTSQAARPVCVAGLANLSSCNVSQEQTRTETQPAAVEGGEEMMDWLEWSAIAIGGLAVICLAGVLVLLASGAGGR